MWGAGVRGPLPDLVPSSHDAFSASWGLDHLLRRDVEQADVTSLMSAVLGIPFPVNGVGVLPDINSTLPGYLKVSPERLARLSLINAKVILEQYLVKHSMSLFKFIYNMLKYCLLRTQARAHTLIQGLLTVGSFGLLRGS